MTVRKVLLIFPIFTNFVMRKKNPRIYGVICVIKKCRNLVAMYLYNLIKISHTLLVSITSSDNKKHFLCFMSLFNKMGLISDTFS